MDGCTFCNKIWNNIKEYRESFEFESQEKIAIIRSSGVYSLYVPCENSQYSKVIMSINFCPKCGRQISHKYRAVAD